MLAGELTPALKRVLAQTGMKIIDRGFQIVAPARPLIGKRQQIGLARRAKLIRANAKQPV